MLAGAKYLLQNPNPNEKPATTIIFSLEMRKEQIAQRLISCEANVNIQMSGNQLDNIDSTSVLHASDIIEKIPMQIDDASALSINEIRSKVKQASSTHTVKLIVVDYLQLVKGSKENKNNREREVAEVSRGLKALAKDYKCPIIALAQSNRNSENTKGIGKKQNYDPGLSDLRESDAIGQDADIVTFLTYESNEEEEKQEMTKNKSPDVIVRFIIVKNRNGSQAKIKLMYKRDINKFIAISSNE
jgi:replicative DNA helicase